MNTSTRSLVRLAASVGGAYTGVKAWPAHYIVGGILGWIFGGLIAGAVLGSTDATTPSAA